MLRIQNKMYVGIWLLLICFVVSLSAQQAAPGATAVVPPMMKFSGVLTDVNSKPLTGTVGVTFALYKESQSGTALWMETQNVIPDKTGHYSVMLGSTTSQGLPSDVFSSGEARWLGVQIQGQAEQPRTVLMSVPYALKAADAETIGGLPPSAFMLALPLSSNGGSISRGAISSSTSIATPESSNVTTTGGTVNVLPLWTSKTNIQSSAISQTGSGATAKIGIGTTTPSVTLDVKGSGTVRGTLTLPATGAANATAGKNSQPQNLVASSFDSSTNTAVNQIFQWQAEPAANNTSHPSGTLNLLYGLGASKPGETGLKLSNKGLFTFAPGQAFPGTGNGTVTSVGLGAPSSDFTVSGSPVTSSGTLGLSWTVAPTSADTVNAIVKRDSSGSFSAGAITSVSPTSGGTAISARTSTGVGVLGAATSDGYGVIGQSSSGFGVYGQSNSFPGVGGVSSANPGVSGLSGSSNGVQGTSESASGYGVYGTNTASGGIGVYGYASGDGVVAVSTGAGAGVYGTSNGGWALDGYGTSGATGVLTGSDTGWAAWFNGDVEVDGNLSKAGGSFKIDHPLDPANKYLYHSFVESPDMKNIYDGNVTTNADGEAVVTLPPWFDALNRDFRYQLTAIGQFAQAMVSKEIANGRFSIKTDKPNVKVSWQVTGIRQDAWANAHRIPVEEPKSDKERGSYLHPELYSAPEEKGVLWARDPRAMKQWKEARTKAAGVSQKENTTKP
jgi:hypothetical protein